jgi:hypothetical protein
LSLSTSAWILITAGATLFNLAAMQWIIQIPEYRKKQFWMPGCGGMDHPDGHHVDRGLRRLVGGHQGRRLTVRPRQSRYGQSLLWINRVIVGTFQRCR